MAARSGMADLITEVRRLTNTGTADITAAGTTWWNDDQIEQRLDRYQKTHKYIQLEGLIEYSGGTSLYFDYPLPANLRWIEQGTATGSGWNLLDGSGSAAPSYTVNYDARMITFDEDTSGTAYYLDVRSYDVYRAAADIWETKAGFYEDYVDWSSDNHRIDASQQVENCKRQAKRLRDMAGASVGMLWRSDEV